MSKKKVRLGLNEKLKGSQGTYTVRGNLSLRAWDREDNRYYDWEEWELISFNKGDVWLECDHFNREISLYEPIRMPEELPNPETLTVGERIRITLPTVPASGRRSKRPRSAKSRPRRGRRATTSTRATKSLTRC